jgi:hypothetical protein
MASGAPAVDSGSGCECCEEDEECSPCGDIISATVRFADIVSGQCQAAGGGTYARFSGAINDTDYVLTSFGLVGGGTLCSDTLSPGDFHDEHSVSDCSDPVDLESQSNITMFYTFSTETWTLLIANNAGNRAVFYNKVSAPLQPGDCIPLTEVFSNEYTGYGQNIDGTGGSSGSLGHSGTAAVTWSI